MAAEAVVMPDVLLCHYSACKDQIFHSFPSARGMQTESVNKTDIQNI